MHAPATVQRTHRAWIIHAAIACLIGAGGCAGPARLGGAPGAASAGPPDTVVVLEVRLRRSGEVADARGGLRVFDQDLRVEYRAGGKGPGLDAGDVTLDGRVLRRVVEGKGSVSYRMGREEPGRGADAEDNAWVSIAATGGARVPAGAARVKLAPFPLVTRPVPGQGIVRAEELPVVMLPPAPDVWYRVSLSGTGDPVYAIDTGEGRWLFPRGTLAGLGSGRARLLFEVETSCADCPGVGPMRANWSTRTELELALTLL